MTVYLLIMALASGFIGQNKSVVHAVYSSAEKCLKAQKKYREQFPKRGYVVEQSRCTAKEVE